MICKKCIHFEACQMWTNMISEIMFYKDLDVEEDKIELSKINDCPFYNNTTKLKLNKPTKLEFVSIEEEKGFI